VLRRLLLYARTARHLRPGQWIYFPLRRAQSLRKPKDTGTAALNLEGMASLSTAARFLCAGPDDGALVRAREVLSHRFSFLNHAEELPVIDWRRRYVSHLWSYNLHYFEYAPDLARAYIETGDPRFGTALESLVSTWINATADGQSDGWEPYPTSVRIINWVHAFLLLEADFSESFRLSMSRSLYRQLSYLEKRLERHLLANHLQKNLYALFLGGLIFRGASADRWRSKGGSMLWAQVEEQVLPDGGHVERSPMYHALALRDLLESIHYARAAGEPVPAGIIGRARGMVSALGAFTRGDRGIHLLNDSAQGVAPSSARLAYLAAGVLGEDITPPAGEWALRSSGFYGHRESATGDALIIDCGNPGPSYQPGHAHCGILSYELDLAGVLVVVDSGVHGYDGDPFREYVRSTRAHNTVAIDGKDQSEMWGTFRIARRARVVTARSSIEGRNYIFHGAYRPFHSRAAIHDRVFTRAPGELSVVDVVRDAPGVFLDSFIHLHPDFSADIRDGNVVARNGVLVVVITPFGTDSIRIYNGESNPVQGWYCPEFGRAIPQSVIGLHVDDNSGEPFGYTIRVESRPA
jgi:uncharacterized heparinase superfamily protein